jgi:predicted metal-dependent phosphoesterase TrpH
MDFHCHSTFSDGTLTPTQLVVTAKSFGLKGLALTDHDNADGVGEFKEAGRKRGFVAVGGVELSVNFSGITHVLGLETAVDPDKRFDLDLSVLKKHRSQRNDAIFAKLADLGVRLSRDRLLELSDGAVMGKPHFALALVESGYARDKEDAFHKYLRRGRPAYAEKIRLGSAEAIRILLDADLAPVLAHPKSLGLSREDFVPAIKKLKENGLVGLEVYHPSHDPEEVGFFMEMAGENDLVPTCGSDYHGANKNIPLNWVIENSDIEFGALEKLNAALAKTRKRLASRSD